ncbi:4'-phosphopantetheinyl transferase family protein [Actinomyces sp. Chiba101]|uniref:4'-phosphopantetheinyl transferase family protein n=1 Tax=Actinomyces TaxID=1654 RepID=UPI000974EC34|nr:MULTISPECIES: 4'-phosphopantetheinyl transferase superfamily protein [Actinomyces]BAW92304.1 4'-phosphopantetheinyl transferase family protein [Actinomyces sp. Chiba101]GAV94757.1 4'-phosphopantetheinyl transferase family protein [Actinomyces denticolens]SUU09964.1 phosphopantetheinyltransferase component of enterobactin synthase multienzyme complex [Actinomyces denticolens]
MIGGPARLLPELVPGSVSVAETREELDEVLHREETALAERMVDRRRREFATVRGCARRALLGLGHRRPPMVPGSAGEPTWPAGVVGSMTHCEHYRAAAVARQEDVDCLGVDAEPNAPLPAGVLARVATTPEELGRLRGLAAERPDVAVDRLLFSVKESLYKAWYPRERRWLGFGDALVRLDDGGFIADLTDPRPGGRTRRLHGRWILAEGTIATAVVVPAGRWDGEAADRLLAPGAPGS